LSDHDLKTFFFNGRKLRRQNYNHYCLNVGEKVQH